MLLHEKVLQQTVRAALPEVRKEPLQEGSYTSTLTCMKRQALMVASAPTMVLSSS